MATFNKVNSFVEHLNEGVHNMASHQLQVVLCASANAPTSSSSVKADLTEIAYTNLSSRNITTNSSSQTSGTYKLIVSDLVLTASGGNVATFRYVVVVNDTPTSPADPIVGYYDYGAGSVALADTETLTIDFDGTNGLYSMV